MATHSSVFGVMNWITERLAEAEWPTHPTTTDPVAVGVGDSYVGQPTGNETVDVVYRIEEDASIEWVTISPADRDEHFLVDIYIRSMVAQDRADLWARLEVLADTAQGVFYNPETREFRPAGWSSTAAGFAPWYHPLGGIARVAPQAWPAQGGWVGDCVVTVAVATRI